MSHATKKLIVTRDSDQRLLKMIMKACQKKGAVTPTVITK